MNAADESERLPHSVGGLLGFALSAWFANAPLYIALAIGVFAAYSVVEYLVPSARPQTPLGDFKLYVLLYTGLFADSLVVAAVAIGVAARAAGAPASPATLAGAAVERWLPVIAVTFLAQTVALLTSPLAGFTQVTGMPRGVLYVTAPLTWILWGILTLTGPFVALGANRGLFSVIIGFGRAFAVSLDRRNVLRLCILGAVAVLPIVLQTALQNFLVQRHVRHAIFWGNEPVDAITIGPLTAVATAFALDFARRAGLLEKPQPPASG
ncbi:MAG: hypothetical protein JO083_07170 [Candidatus Eremiobacteraeota bacterium]|nr:hypothetical protein [Candidatus Eremiobacteraeota bacterium]